MLYANSREHFRNYCLSHVQLIAFLNFALLFLKIICRVSVEMSFFDIVHQLCIQREHLGAIQIIREPVWSWLRDHCASLTTMSANAAFSDILTTNTIGASTDDVKSVFLIQQRNQSFCSLCDKYKTICTTNILMTELSTNCIILCINSVWMS